MILKYYIRFYSVKSDKKTSILFALCEIFWNTNLEDDYQFYSNAIIDPDIFYTKMVKRDINIAGTNFDLLSRNY